ncbi:hypothetical protein DFH08DRAFT_807437 [Mycena albidolilacea]|uniref:Uncharacterized protein n=1 Tax=Mycena albidolilacea TaxID=1033008 RepID=A0AAD7ERS2_9AGAR|nr:hypothetical protein DFH08DRAFT_807437 [Mycena albidolilacea]
MVDWYELRPTLPTAIEIWFSHAHSHIGARALPDGRKLGNSGAGVYNAMLAHSAKSAPCECALGVVHPALIDHLTNKMLLSLMDMPQFGWVVPGIHQMEWFQEEHWDVLGHIGYGRGDKGRRGDWASGQDILDYHSKIISAPLK